MDLYNNVSTVTCGAIYVREAIKPSGRRNRDILLAINLIFKLDHQKAQRYLYHFMHHRTSLIFSWRYPSLLLLGTPLPTKTQETIWKPPMTPNIWPEISLTFCSFCFLIKTNFPPPKLLENAEIKFPRFLLKCPFLFFPFHKLPTCSHANSKLERVNFFCLFLYLIFLLQKKEQ